MSTSTQSAIGPVLVAHLSAPRFASYLAVASDADHALELYRWNVEMAGALHEMLGLAEVFVRNAIDAELQKWNAAQPPGFGTTYDSRWVENPARPLWAILNPPSSHPHAPRRSTYNTAFSRAEEDRHLRGSTHRRHGMPVDHDDVVAHITFGTWKALLPRVQQNGTLGRPSQMVLWSGALQDAFSHHKDPAVIGYWVNRLHGLRNRVAHLEPLLNTDVLSYHRTTSRLLRAIEPQLGDWYAGTSRVPSLAAQRP